MCGKYKIQSFIFTALLIWVLIALNSKAFAAEECEFCEIKVQSIETPIPLSGTWLFTRNDLPQNRDKTLDTKNWKTIKVPGPWKGVYDDKKNFKVGWYRTQLQFDPALIGEEVVVLIDSYMGKMDVFLDGEEIYRRTGNHSTGRYYSIQPVPVRFKISQTDHTLAFRIDTLLMTGVYQLPFQLRKYKEKDVSLALLQLWGGEVRMIAAYLLLFSGLFFLLVYSKTRYHLYLYAALAGILIFPFFAAPGDNLVKIFPPEKLFLLHYVGLFAGFFHFLFSQFFHRFTPKINIFFGGLAGIMALSFAFMAFVSLNFNFFLILRPIYFVVILSIGIFMEYNYVKGMIAKMPGSRIMVFGGAVFLLSGLNDMLLALGAINSIGMIFVGFLTGTGCILIYATKLFADTFVENKVLLNNLQLANDSLESANENLEQEVSDRTSELRAKSGQIQSMLDNLPEGIFTFGESMKVQNEYSAFCLEIFGEEIEDQEATRLLFKHYIRSDSDEASANQVDASVEIFQLIFSEIDRFELYESLLPHEVQIRERIFLIKYQMVKGETAEDHQLMLILSDITKERLMEEKIKSDEERNLMFIRIAMDKDGFIRFMNELERLFKQIEQLLELPAQKIDWNELFRYFHTLKGGTASYGFNHIASSAHSIENHLEEIRSEKTNVTDNAIQHLKDKSNLLKQEFYTTLQQLGEIFTLDELKGQKPTFKISEEKIKRIEELLEKDRKSNKNLMQKAVYELRKQPIAPVLRKLGNNIDRLAGS